MKIEYLRYFLCASKSESLTKAAEQLHFSQQGLSRVIKAMESEYGVRLFSRSNTKSSLTPAGRELRKHAETVLDEYERLERSMREFTRNEERQTASLTLYMTLNTMHHAYPLFADMIRSAFPCWSIRIVEVDQKNIVSKIYEADNANALFFVSIPLPILEKHAKDPQLFFMPLIDTELDVVVARNSSLAGRKKLTWGDLENIKFALLKDEGMIDLLRKSPSHKLLDKSDLWISDNKILESLMENDDIATFSTSFLSKCADTSRFVHISLEDTFSTPIGFFSHEEREVSQEAVELANFIETYFVHQHPEILFHEHAVLAKRWVPRFTRP